MRFQNIKVLAGSTLSLSVLLSLVAVSPSAAEAIREVPVYSREQMEMNGANRMVGTVKSIIGDVVTLELPNGRTREIGLNRMEQGALGLVPGMKLVVTMEDGDRIVRLAPFREVTVAARPASTRVETTRPTATMERVERRVDRTTIETRPVERMPEPEVIEQRIEQRTVVEETFSEPTPVQPSRPVRALW